ncbi:hypothetical protein [Leptospira sarikeiensis]|uniref:Uncharacterized protein n=1 Tax=Leptospira sarikeiensis TaxID=2484943 RepID=A0A4R9K6I7_9LEPT|nr:hypothetical protein [Leptospira sarikeiensis]TGL61166.1 hypothetical protein EHQ64_11150 [Leptospira sarikeiensis]
MTDDFKPIKGTEKESLLELLRKHQVRPALLHEDSKNLTITLTLQIKEDNYFTFGDFKERAKEYEDLLKMKFRFENPEYRILKNYGILG